jgi:hypothetical protein
MFFYIKKPSRIDLAFFVLMSCKIAILALHTTPLSWLLRYLVFAFFDLADNQKDDYHNQDNTNQG